MTRHGDDEISHLAHNLIRLRLKLGLTQTQLATSAGVGEGVVKMAETKKRFPRIHNLQALAMALGVSVQDLISPENKPVPPPITIQELARTITDQAAEIAEIKSSSQVLSEDESELIGVFRKLGRMQRSEVIAHARRIFSLDNPKTTPTRKRG